MESRQARLPHSFYIEDMLVWEVQKRSDCRATTHVQFLLEAIHCLDYLIFDQSWFQDHYTLYYIVFFRYMYLNLCPHVYISSSIKAFEYIPNSQVQSKSYTTSTSFTSYVAMILLLMVLNQLNCLCVHMYPVVHTCPHAHTCPHNCHMNICTLTLAILRKFPRKFFDLSIFWSAYFFTTHLNLLR